MKKPKVVFLGNEALSSAKDYDQAPIFESLLKQNTIEALIIKLKPTTSRLKRQFTILKIAKQYGIPVIKVTNTDELINCCKKIKADLGIVASFGLIIPKSIIDHFPGGIINVHPSLLPKYRGVTPIETALLNGDKQTGISLMKLDQELDAGDIYDQRQLEIPAGITKLILTQQLAGLASEMLSQDLIKIIRNELPAQAQNHQLASYTKPIKPRLITDLKQADAKYWQRYVQAFIDCANNKFLINQQTVRLIEVQALPSSTETYPLQFYNQLQELLCLETKHGYLGIKRLKPLNKQQMTAKEFVNGFWQQIPKSSDQF